MTVKFFDSWLTPRTVRLILVGVLASQVADSPNAAAVSSLASRVH